MKQSPYRIGVDLSLLSQFSFTGIVTYARCILPYLFRGIPDAQWVLFMRPDASGMANAWSEYKNLEIHTPKSMQREWFWKTVGLPWAAATQKLNLLFMPVSRAPLIQQCPVITCIHDLGYRTQPQYLKRRTVTKTKLAIRHAIRASDGLIAGSEFTRKEICSEEQVDPAKITVAYYGYDSQQFHAHKSARTKSNAVLAKYGVRKPYVLYVGIIQGRKNLGGLIQAAQIWRVIRPELQLVLAGKRGWNCEEIYESAASYTNSQVHLPGVIEENDLCTLYQEAECFVLPSFYEGFGIPAIEAMACGCPVLLSDVAALPETGGSAARYFDPTQSDQIAKCVLRVVETPELRERMSTVGLEHVRFFTWERCAARMLPAFRRLILRHSQFTERTLSYGSSNLD